MHPALAGIGRQLAAARRRLGLSQAVVADRTGTTQAAVSRMEQARVDPQLTTVLDLARGLELELRLVPRQAIPGVDATIRATMRSLNAAGGDATRDTDQPLYALGAGAPGSGAPGSDDAADPTQP